MLDTLEFLISVAPQINVPPGKFGRNNKRIPSNKRTPSLKKDDFHDIRYLKSNFINLKKALLLKIISVPPSNKSVAPGIFS